MDLQKTTDQQPVTTQQPTRPRYLVLVPLGILFKREYDGHDEAAAKAAYWRAIRLNQVPVLTEVRQMVIA